MKSNAEEMVPEENNRGVGKGSVSSRGGATQCRSVWEIGLGKKQGEREYSIGYRKKWVCIRTTVYRKREKEAEGVQLTPPVPSTCQILGISIGQKLNWASHRHTEDKQADRGRE